VLLAGASVAAVALTAQIRPRISSSFFFGEDDPALRADRAIDRSFPSPPFVVISAEGDPEDPGYRRRIWELTEDLAALPGVWSVQSLARGPEDLDAARAGPLWSRLLLEGPAPSSRLLVLLEEDFGPGVIAATDSVIAAWRPRLDLTASGIPWIIEHMRIALERDLRAFGLATLAILGTVVLLLFRSWKLVVGVLAACVTASSGTILLVNALGVPIGLLTANLGTIVAVLTLSHVVFLVSNWLDPEDGSHGPGRTLRAVRRTASPAFWSMASTALGFASLWWVHSEPLRNLGVAGVLGSAVALAAAFLILPPVLQVLPSDAGRPRRRGGSRLARLSRSRALALAAGLASLGAAWPWLRTDPPVLAYFAEGSDIHRGLARVDRSFGSSPLHVVLRDAEGREFDDGSVLARLEALEEDLQQDESTGTVLGLPLILRQAEESSLLARLLPTGALIGRLASEEHDRMARSFVSEDRERAVLRLYLREEGRSVERREVIERIRERVRRAGFVDEALGGPYVLLERLADLVDSSARRGVLLLLAVMGIAVASLTRSLRVAFAASASLALLPVALLGAFALLRLPLDVIAAPSLNLAVALGADALFHLLASLRREAAGPEPGRAWDRARQRLAAPVLRSAVLVVAGFAIFGFSAFPPSRRFGLSVALGGLLAAPVALAIFPAFVALLHRRPR
jgi:predicted RND superfamily exporter protein